jgi:hypothetical protein
MVDNVAVIFIMYNDGLYIWCSTLIITFCIFRNNSEVKYLILDTISTLSESILNRVKKNGQNINSYENVWNKKTFVYFSPSTFMASYLHQFSAGRTASSKGAIWDKFSVQY